MAKRKKAVKTNPITDWIPAKAVRLVKRGSRRALQILTARRNVAAGFRDDEGIFHPIRASYDYQPSRAGEARKFTGRRKR